MAAFNNETYRQFFDIDENYFPCIDDSAIEAGAPWETTYPHEKFIELLKHTEKMLGGTTRRSIWIHGAYGTGKSQCAYALKKILEVSEEDVKKYWNSYDPLKDQVDLLQKILGHKERRIITTYRYASGSITTPRELFFAIQESITKALKEDKRIQYYGDTTLKESVIAWIEDEAHKNFFNALLQKPEWKAMFAQSNADEVLNVLRKSSNVKDVMEHIFTLADKEGIKAMSLDADILKTWIKDVIEKNDIKLVFIWDEFSGFFKQNRNSLDEFQKVVALCQEAPFYFVVVTHQTDSIINNEDQSWSVVKQRFEFVQITLPDNIAFDLIGHAFDVKEAAKETWEIYAKDLNDRLVDSRKAVMAAAKISNPKVIKDIMPLHPMTALVLKNIASAFKSNQRSMFDFIKTTNTDDVKAFQWFIENHGPTKDNPLLTVDMLWNFFYEKGREDLTPDIRMILDTFPQQGNLRADEERVLKTILIMQAIDKRLGGSIDVLKPTEQNISYAFEGITEGLDVNCKNIAKALKDKGILVLNPIGDKKFAYGAAVLAGDQAKIDEYKRIAKLNSTTAKLVYEGNLASVLSLSAALRLRYAKDPYSSDGALIPVTSADFTRTVRDLRDRVSPWHFNAVIAFAKDVTEATSFRKTIKEYVESEEYNGLIVIDALDSPLGDDDFDSYLNYVSMAQYYQSNNNPSARDNQNNATRVLSTNWKNKVYSNTFYLYYDGCTEGEKAVGGSAVENTLKSIVLKKCRKIFDFNKGITENQLKLTQEKNSAKCGITRTANGVMANADKSLFPQAWGLDNYWDSPVPGLEDIAEIKKAVDQLVLSAFDKDGQVAIGDVYDLVENTYGFAPCNLSAFIVGFVLKEYSSEPFRYLDSNGTNETMTPDKLAEMLSNYIKKRSEPTFIVKMTAEERAFYSVTEKAWGIHENSCSSASMAAMQVKTKMQTLGLPVWSLESVDTAGVYDIVRKYIELVQKEGKEAHAAALLIGRISQERPQLGDQLSELISPENCQKGMWQYLQDFEGGELLSVSTDIDAKDNVLKDIGRLFSVENASLWDIETGKEQIRRLTDEYSFVRIINKTLELHASSLPEANASCKEKLSYCICSCEALQQFFTTEKEAFDILRRVYNDEQILPDQLRGYIEELARHSDSIRRFFDDEEPVFAKIYAPYLEGIEKEEISKLRGNDLFGIFGKSKTEGNKIVKQCAEEFRKNQARTQMFTIWKEKTGSKNPRDWSSKNRTPILNLLSEEEYDTAKKAFDVLNRNTASDTEIQQTLTFLQETCIYEKLGDKDAVDNAFRKTLGNYQYMFLDLADVRDALEAVSSDAYEWGTHPRIKARIVELAQKEYDAGGSDQVVGIIQSMNDDELRERLIADIRENMELGLEIINGRK